MDLERYLRMNSGDFSKNLITDILADPTEGKKLVDALAATQKYQRDFEFRTAVDTGRGLTFTLFGEHKNVLELCSDLIERASALQMWDLVATNQNFLGNAYYTMGILERALEYYNAVIETEKSHSLLSMTSIAYNNIALIYSSLDSPEKTYEFLNLAIESLERGGSEQPRYHSKLVYYWSDLIEALCKMDQLDKVPAIFEKINQIDMDLVNPSSKHVLMIAKMYYAFHTGEYQQGKKIYYEIIEGIDPSNVAEREHILNLYIRLCKRFDIDQSFYLDHLLQVEIFPDSKRETNYVDLYKDLREYFRAVNNKQKYDDITERYVVIYEKFVKEMQMSRLASMETVHGYLQGGHKYSEIENRNRELRLIAEEAIRHKNASQEAYARLEMINELGKNMTSSLDLEEVVELIYKNLRENIPLSSFILVFLDHEHHQLRSAIYYENDVLQPQVRINLDDPNSVFVECYRSNEIILSDNIRSDKRFRNRTLRKVGDSDTQSAIFMPLSLGEQLIGVCSIQDTRENIYTEKDIEFLEELLPYLSIATNNAIRSWTLETEIRSHLDTQRQLQSANQKLERLSSLDGLTQISNRRDFEFRILGLLHASSERNLNIAVLMFDIDNFKLYNDTYGHLEGDEALKKVAHIVRNNLDKVDGLSARFGGEEFIGACIGLDSNQIAALAEQIRHDVFALAIENKKAPLGQLSVSIGIAVANGLSEEYKSNIMRWADISLYQAKNTGKNKVVVKEIDSNDEPPGRLELELENKNHH